jgi:hypothetical protein
MLMYLSIQLKSLIKLNLIQFNNLFNFYKKIIVLFVFYACDRVGFRNFDNNIKSHI